VEKKEMGCEKERKIEKVMWKREKEKEEGGREIQDL
jgi:hypothetical protein